MLATQPPRTNDEFSRCEDRSHITDHGKSLGPREKTDAALKEHISRAFRKDEVLRAIEYHEIDIRVKDGIVYLNGHIAGMTSKNRIDKAVRTIPNILGIRNYLVVDDKLTLEVAASLGTMEHTYQCKFFTGVSHGVVSLNGVVSDEHLKLLAEKNAASNPNVRGVINHVRVSGTEPALQDQPFLQPSIGETIYFLDGISGVVKQVIINPNNRRVVAMTVGGEFRDQRQDLKALKNGEARSPERLIVLSLDVVRYLTQVSGFLTIKSTEKSRYLDFDPASFCTPDVDWAPPYPYCPSDVLFAVEKQEANDQLVEPLPPAPLAAVSREQLLWEQLLANNDSLGD